MFFMHYISNRSVHNIIHKVDFTEFVVIEKSLLLFNELGALNFLSFLDQCVI